jgi:DNA-binding PadR family transcriptional regulator
VRAEWHTSENNRRAKYYILTDTGRRKLRSEQRDWESQAAAIARILRTSPGEV